MTTSPLNTKTAAITASYSGLGFELSRLLLADGYRLICLDRNEAKSDLAHEKLRAEFSKARIQCIQTDMASPISIANTAEQMLVSGEPLDLLFHVAGAATATKQMSPQGNEVHFEVNTLGPIAMTRALRSILAKSEASVVVVVGSSAMKMAKTLSISKLVNPTSFKKMTGPYAQSKLAVTTAMIALSKEFATDGILLRIVDPGPSRTPMSASDAMPGFVRLIRRWFPLPEVGARKIYSAASLEKYGHQSGIYIERNAVAKLPAAASDARIQTELLALIAERSRPSLKASS